MMPSTTRRMRGTSLARMPTAPPSSSARGTDTATRDNVFMLSVQYPEASTKLIPNRPSAAIGNRPAHQPKPVTSAIITGQGIVVNSQFEASMPRPRKPEKTRITGLISSRNQPSPSPIHCVIGSAQASGQMTSHGTYGSRIRLIAPAISATSAAQTPLVMTGPRAVSGTWMSGALMFPQPAERRPGRWDAPRR